MRAIRSVKFEQSWMRSKYSALRVCNTFCSYSVSNVTCLYRIFDDDDHPQAPVTVHTCVVPAGIRRRPAASDRQR